MSLPGRGSKVIGLRPGEADGPSTVRAYDEAVHLHVLDSLGGMRLGDVQRLHVQRLAEDVDLANGAIHVERA